MVDLETRPPGRRDPGTRAAALWATVVAVPVAVLVGFLILTRIVPQADEAVTPDASGGASAPAVAVPDEPVPMDAPDLSDRAREVCLAVTSRLPVEVRGMPARPVSAGPEQNAAYGEPPLTVACGVARPVLCDTGGGPDGCVPLDAELLNMDRVCWFTRQDGDRAVFTTMDREVAVAVTVPGSYGQAAQWANEFSAAVAGTDPRADDDVPVGCV